MSNSEQREKRYQAIRLYNSGVISLSDLKAKFRIVSTLADPEYTNPKKLDGVLGTKSRIETLERLTRTRGQATGIALKKYRKPPPVTSNREEQAAKFVTKFRGNVPHNWKRYGTLVKRSSKENPPRLGTARRLIRDPRYQGFEEFNKDFDYLIRALADLDGSKQSRRAVSSALRKSKASANVTVKRG